MPITSITKDPESLTMTVVADFAVPVRRLWDAYLDPRLLEQFWSPPSCPTVFTRHDGCAGGRTEFTMTLPDGNVMNLSWDWISVDEPKSFEIHDADGPDTPGPARMVFSFEETASGSRLVATTYFHPGTEVEQEADGMAEGMTAAMSQMDTVLADLASFATGKGTVTQVLNDTQVRVSRVIRGDVATVWRAHHEPALLQQWLLGPDGWTMPVCEVATEVGQTYRYEWAQVDGQGHFGFTGTLLEILPPHRSVQTESMIGTDDPSSTNELTLTAVADGTLLSMLMVFPDSAVRDAALRTGMTDGMETSYRRLESLIS